MLRMALKAFVTLSVWMVVARFFGTGRLERMTLSLEAERFK